MLKSNFVREILKNHEDFCLSLLQKRNLISSVSFESEAEALRRKMKNNSITIKQQEAHDLPAICRLIEEAFASVQESNHREQFLVTRLLSSPGFIPELSLTAWIQNELVGYILLTEVEILSDSTSKPSLSLAPLAVRPKFQKQGIGAALIKEAHKRACQLNYETILVLGHKDYYPRFGYKKAENFGITFPFEVQPEFCMVKELTPGAASRAAGQVKYPKAFFEY